MQLIQDKIQTLKKQQNVQPTSEYAKKYLIQEKAVKMFGKAELEKSEQLLAKQQNLTECQQTQFEQKLKQQDFNYYQQIYSLESQINSLNISLTEKSNQLKENLEQIKKFKQEINNLEAEKLNEILINQQETLKSKTEFQIKMQDLIKQNNHLYKIIAELEQKKTEQLQNIKLNEYNNQILVETLQNQIAKLNDQIILKSNKTDEDYILLVKLQKQIQDYKTTFLLLILIILAYSLYKLV
ncbi:Hypothetical_protein [Hexamita inflata]|uniref:Hypothetical_protein n=1 Tax=Hexamita inflata TaxID=28002 RepID=A0ABP1HQZ0_9EUKA